MGKNKVLVKVHPEGKYVVDIDKGVDRSKIAPGMRVALRNDSYALHLLLPTKVDPLVSLMKVEKVPDSTYDMVGGLDRQIKVRRELWRSFGKEREREKAEEENERKRISSPPPPSSSSSPSTPPAGDQGGHRAPHQAPGALRRPGRRPAERRAALRPPGDRKDFAGTCSRPPHGLHLHPGLRLRAGPEVHRGGVPHGQGAVRDGEGARAVDHLHGRGGLKFFCFFLPFSCFSDLNRVFSFRFFLSFSLTLEKPTKQNQQQVDSIGSARGGSGGGGGDSEVQRTMLELLNQLDGFESTNKIKVLMATNRIDILDAALLRPGRIDRKIEFPNPSESSRVDILRIHSRKMNLVRGIDLQKVADKMGGASGKEGERGRERGFGFFFFRFRVEVEVERKKNAHSLSSVLSFLLSKTPLLLL